MNGQSELCMTPTPCPMLLSKNSTNCGFQVMHGREACWRRDGRWEDLKREKGEERE